MHTASKVRKAVGAKGSAHAAVINARVRRYDGGAPGGLTFPSGLSDINAIKP